jgi:hypothetical protein
VKQLPWRVQSNDDGGFDEIVVGSGKGMILHAEMMNDRSCFIDLAGLRIWVTVGRDGVARVTETEQDK